MVSTNVKVARWAALAFGITYGFVYKRSLINSEAKKKEKAEYEHKEELINKAKAAYASRLPTDGVITDPDNPKFDLEKLLTHVDKSNAY